MNRHASDAAPVEDGIPRQEVPHETSEGHDTAARKRSEREKEVFKRLLIVTFVMFVVLAAGFAIRVFTDPELRKALTTSREETTAQLVVKRMREEFGMKPQSQDSEGHERPAQTWSKSARMDSTVDGRTEELNLRLDRLESLIVQLAGKVDAGESAMSLDAPTESGSHLDHVNLRLDRIESLLSQPSNEVNRPDRGAASDSHEKTLKPRTLLLM